MSCSGLHCAGCGAGGGAPVLALGAALGFVWVAEHIIEVAAVSASCAILAVAAMVWLTRRQERREASYAAAHGILSRADAIAPVRAVVVERVPERPAIAPVIVNIFGQPTAEQAAVIRRALERN